MFPLGLGPRRLGVSPSMNRWLTAQATSGQVDIIHNHGLWMMPNVYTGRACAKASRTRLIVSPRGTLSAWARARSAFQKKIFWRLLQAPALRSTACFHATAESEYEDIRRLGFAQPVCVIPNGIDVPSVERQPRRQRRQLLFLGRIHPVKGVDMLLRAWSLVEHRFPNWDLRIVGPDNGGYLFDMKQLAASLGTTRVTFPGPLYGPEKADAYRAADLFVLPSHSENFGVALAEALAVGVPAIATKGTPWQGLETQGAGWWIDMGTESLVSCFDRALSMSTEQLAAMGRAGRAWMHAQYAWSSVASRFLSVYAWLLQASDPPASVRLD
jgi:glycosyltransferase involved in cell wall biosynthesis